MSFTDSLKWWFKEEYQANGTKYLKPGERGFDYESWMSPDTNMPSQNWHSGYLYSN
jgi:hypothetical protein